MARDFSADIEKFNPDEYANTPLLAAIESLCKTRGLTLDECRAYSMGQIYEMATEEYGDALPDIWKVWRDWNRPDLQQPMGDL